MQQQPVRPSSMPNAVFGLLIANGLVYLLQLMNTRFMTIYFALWPVATPVFEPWQLVTYAFLHSPLPNEIFHIVFNMLMLWMFGRDLANLWGNYRFLVYFMTCAIGAGIVQLIVAHLQADPYPTLGASGGVFGILLAYAMTFPDRRVFILLIPIPVKVKYAVIFFGILELIIGVTGAMPRIANFAHLGGMLFGFFLLRHWSKPRPR